jgi:hypothetical protein
MLRSVPGEGIVVAAVGGRDGISSGVGLSAESRLSTGETSPAPNKSELSGVKTLLVTVRPKALIEEPMSGNMDVAGRTIGGGLKEGGVDVVASPVLSRLRYLATPLNSVAHT